jgi:hypothetical protein
MTKDRLVNLRELPKSKKPETAKNPLTPIVPRSISPRNPINVIETKPVSTNECWYTTTAASNSLNNPKEFRAKIDLTESCFTKKGFGFELVPRLT